MIRATASEQVFKLGDRLGYRPAAPSGLGDGGPARGRQASMSAVAQCPTADGFDFRTPQAGTSDQRLIYYTFDAPICGSTYDVSEVLSDSVTS